MKEEKNFIECKFAGTNNLSLFHIHAWGLYLLGIEEFWVVIFFEHIEDISLSSDFICQSKATASGCFLNYFLLFLFLKLATLCLSMDIFLFILWGNWGLVSSISAGKSWALSLHLFLLHPLSSLSYRFHVNTCYGFSLFSLCLSAFLLFFCF